jgi:hypothetical protein
MNDRDYASYGKSSNDASDDQHQHDDILPAAVKASWILQWVDSLTVFDWRVECSNPYKGSPNLKSASVHFVKTRILA